MLGVELVSGHWSAHEALKMSDRIEAMGRRSHTLDIGRQVKIVAVLLIEHSPRIIEGRFRIDDEAVEVEDEGFCWGHATYIPMIW